MSLDHVVLDFLQRIAIGAGVVLLLLVLIRFGMPRRDVAASRHRPIS